MSDYTKTIQTNGKSQNIADNIADVFINRGYLIEKKNDKCIELKQTVRPNRNNDPLEAVSHISIEIRASEITVNADLKGFDMLFRILAIMIISMALIFFILFGFIIEIPAKSRFLRYTIALLPLAPWPILLPLMKNIGKNSGAKILDNVIHNAAMTAREN